MKRDSLFSFSRADTLVFDGGRLRAVGALAARFPATAYSAHSAEGAASDAGTVWTASARDEGGTAISWQGVVSGDRIEGTVLLSRAGGKVLKFSFKGNKKPA